MASDPKKDTKEEGELPEIPPIPPEFAGNEWIVNDHRNEAIRQTSDRETSSIDPSD